MVTKQDSPSPASDEPEYEIDSFELLWEQHKAKVIGGAIALVVILAAVFGWFIVTGNQKAAAEAALAGAKTLADYRAVLENYPSSPEAGPAALLLGKSLRDEKKYDEANQALNGFADKQPDHPLTPLAKVAVAENLALAGKADEAAKALAAIAQTDPKSFAAPYALWLSAELRSAQGQREPALQAYRELERTFPKSVSAQVAQQTKAALEALADTPAPAVEPTATPKP